VTDPTAWDDGSYRVVFNAGNWQALDASNVVVASAAYSAGAPIEFRGARLVIEGVPADGDRFDVGPARSQDLFSTVQNLIDGLVQPSVTPAQRTAQRNAIFTSLEDLDRAQQHLLDVRAGIGARLNVIDGADAEREASDVQLRTTLSELRDVDLAEAISRLELEMTALEAAQQSFIRIQSLSLFQFLR
jgi:flagellar hook-associated protein 3 FlgL